MYRNIYIKKNIYIINIYIFSVLCLKATSFERMLRMTKRKLVVWLLVCCLHNLPTTSFSLRDANRYR